MLKLYEKRLICICLFLLIQICAKTMNREKSVYEKDVESSPAQHLTLPQELKDSTPTGKVFFFFFS